MTRTPPRATVIGTVLTLPSWSRGDGIVLRQLGDLRMYGRFAWGLRAFLRQPLSLEQAQASIRKRVAEREANFLRLMERGVFGHPRSPYRALLGLARCELGDLRLMVRSRGLEGTLRALRDAGVYVTFEEFKGRTPIVRDGHVLHVRAEDFDNPHLSRYYQAESGGSTGAGTRVMTDLDHLAVKASQLMVTDEAHGLLSAPTAIWFGVLPDVGLNIVLTRARYGRVPEKWFVHVTPSELRPSLVYRVATGALIAAGRLYGVPIPRPEPVALEDAAIVARWAARAARQHGACMVRTQVSRALRVCLAAREEGLDLSGVAITGGGEPPTPGKVREITRAGARWIPGYYTMEADAVGMGCGHPLDGNDLHLLKDHLALIQWPRPVPGWDVEVDAFNFTTLLPTAPKIMLNAESDDYGVLESRPCGCPLEGYGFTDHIRHVHSFRKLTGEGVTLVGTDMLRILDEVLPARFGGTPLDYQVLEEEDSDGFTRLSLVVSPKISLPDDRSVIETVMDSLRQSDDAADLARATWRQAGTWRIRRMEPIWTARGKLMPLHLAERARPAIGAER